MPPPWFTDDDDGEEETGEFAEQEQDKQGQDRGWGGDDAEESNDKGVLSRVAVEFTDWYTAEGQERGAAELNIQATSDESRRSHEIGNTSRADTIVSFDDFESYNIDRTNGEKESPHYIRVTS